MRANQNRFRTLYSEDFRSDALKLIRAGDRSMRQLSTDLGVSYWTLREWSKKDLMAKKTKAKPVSRVSPAVAGETEEQELARLRRENESLRRENDSLRMDREILKKAAAFFAKESE